MATSGGPQHSCQTLANGGSVAATANDWLASAYAASMRKPDWGFGIAALVAGLMAVAIVVMLILGLRGLF